MERMLCETCAAVIYSAAARKMVESGERCPRCGGPLALETDERVATGAPADERTRGVTERSER